MNLKNVNNLLDNAFSNSTFKMIVSLMLALYAGAVAPSLPNSVVRMFDTNIGKFLLILL